MTELGDQRLICRTPDDWDEYRRRYEEARQGWPEGFAADWSDRHVPLSYPVLVHLTLALTDAEHQTVRLVPVLVYPADGAALLAAAGWAVDETTPTPSATAPAPAPARPQVVKVNTVGATQAETNRQFAAFALATARALRDLGLRADTLERYFTAALPPVEQFEATRNEQILAAVDFADVLLPRMLPEAPPALGS